MSNIKRLKELLESEIMPQLEDVINSIFKTIKEEGTISLGEKEDLEEFKNMHKECREILIDIESGQMEEDEAKELLEELLKIKNS